MQWNDLFHYENGQLYWKIAPTTHVKPGDLAGYITTKGYVQITYQGKGYKAHRIIWEMYNGSIPDGYEIDHEDRNKANNLLSNLRLVIHAVNNKNNSKRCDNTTGVTGVTWRPKVNKWQARIFVNGKSISLGFHKEFADAVKARHEAEMTHDFHPTHGK